MKLRIQGNSLRLRLTRAEVQQLRSDGRVTESIRFGPVQQMSYTVEASETAERLQAHYDGDAVTVLLPAAWAASWPDDDRVGFDEAQPLGDGDVLELLVEKDFKCLHKDRDADAEALYAHPDAGGSA